LKKGNQAAKGRHWSEEENIIAMEFYRRCPEKMHTDSHPKCKELAGILKRPPGGVDRHIRNIKYVVTGRTGLSHVSEGVKEVVAQYKNDFAGLKKRAAAIRKEHGWPPLSCND